MITSLVISLQSLADGELAAGTGRAVHGLWFRVWKEVDAAQADALHAHAVPPFTLSPLMGLPRPRRGAVTVVAGQAAWFRITTLTEPLSRAMETGWLPALPAEVELAGTRWQVTGYTWDSAEHPWAGRARYRDLARRLLGKGESRTWKFRFATPTTFHGGAGHLAFPLPDSLVASWLRRWNAFAPIALPDELVAQVRQGVVVSAYHLKTVPVRYGERLVVGAVGWARLRALNLHPAMAAALDVLAHYAFYCGSGAKTAQGMGLTALQTRASDGKE